LSKNILLKDNIKKILIGTTNRILNFDVFDIGTGSSQQHNFAKLKLHVLAPARNFLFRFPSQNLIGVSVGKLN
jgi:hypothetical protein